MKAEWKKFLAAIGLSSVETSPDGAFIPDDAVSNAAKLHEDFEQQTKKLSDVEAALQAANQTVSDREAKIVSLTNELTTAQDTITNLTSERDSLKAELAKRPAATVTIATDGNEGNPAAKNTEVDQEVLDNLPHNKMADSLLGTNNNSSK